MLQDMGRALGWRVWEQTGGERREKLPGSTPGLKLESKRSGETELVKPG